MSGLGRSLKESVHQGSRSRAERRSLSESLADSTSKFFSNMLAKKNGLFSDISTKIENTFTPRTDTVSNSTGSEGSISSPGTPPVPNNPPPRPPPPKRLPSMGNSCERFSMHDDIRSISKQEIVQDMKSSDLNHVPNQAIKALQKRFSLNGMSVSFDEPIYNQPEPNPSQPVTNISVSDTDISISDSLLRGVHISKTDHVSDCYSDLQAKLDLKFQKSEKINDLANFHADGYKSIATDKKQHYNDHYRHGDYNHNPRKDENKSNESKEETENRNNMVQEKKLNGETTTNATDEGRKSDIDFAPLGQDGIREAKQKPPKFTASKRRSNTIDEILFDDYEQPDVDVFISEDQLPEDLMCFEPESQTENAFNSQETSLDYSETEFGGTVVQRSNSVESEKSYSSNLSVDSQPDDVMLECMEFMKSFVEKVFSTSEEISQTEKAKFGELCQHFPGRLWFSRQVNSQRVHNKTVPETTFFRLMQYFAVCLFECEEAEDFSPAKTLMSLCFIFHYEAPSSPSQTEKVFLSLYLRDQPIWQSLKFWNAAYFDASQSERCRRNISTNPDRSDVPSDDRQIQENVTFRLLRTFACNMREFGLSKELCLEFLRKQSATANLHKEQVKILKENLDGVQGS